MRKNIFFTPLKPEILSGMTLVASAIILLGIFSCSAPQEPEGKKLAIQYCQSCHLLPDPKLLDKNTWAFEVLPMMGARLGYHTGNNLDIQTLKEMHLFPDTALLSSKEWEQLKNYIMSEAPIYKEAAVDIQELTQEMEKFEVIKPTLMGESPFTTMIHFDSLSQQLFYGNATQKTLNTFDLNGGKGKSVVLNGAPSHLIARTEGYYVLTMGQVMPHDMKIGTLTFLPQDKLGEWGQPEIWIDDLQRPVHANLADLDGDGKEDMVIAAFGNNIGELAWYSDIASPERIKHVLRPLPGAIKTVVSDFNHDGSPDILALMAQGDEGFFLYNNDGKGNFTEEAILRFPPSYGSTFFEWKDMDGDGMEDILYVNGDNGDYPPIVKDFHGMRLFKNKGNMKFEEILFIEHHGAFKATVSDYDQDGDLDLAAISYFPDYENRQPESFIYYENKGNFKYEASTFETQPSGKWLTMESGDLDKDGDMDIILGSAFFMVKGVPAETAGAWRKQVAPLVILQNSANP